MAGGTKLEFSIGTEFRLRTNENQDGKQEELNQQE
jgi:hypothetical protein